MTAAAEDGVLPQPPPPFFIQTFSEQIERAYLRYRARSTLQRQYRQLLNGADPDTLPPLGRKRVRKSEELLAASNGAEPLVQEEDGAAGVATSTPAFPNGIIPERAAPHIDDVYRLDLSVAKPDAGILAIGDAPSDVYLPPPPPPSNNPTGARELENRQIIQILLDKTWESDTLFYDLDGLTHEQIKQLSEVEWSRELPAPPPFYASFPSSLTAMSNSGKENSLHAAKLQQQQQQQHLAAAKYNKRKQSDAMMDDEKDLDDEVEYIKRSFCDKSRAHALAARGAAVW